MAGELDGQVTGEAVWRFHNDGLHAIAGDAVQHLGEARPGGDVVGAFDVRIIEPIDDD
jgi:hypothetical protein